MIETLAADVQSGSGDTVAALKTYRDARARFPQDRALIYGAIDAQLLAGRADEAPRLPPRVADFSRRCPPLVAAGEGLCRPRQAPAAASVAGRGLCPSRPVAAAVEQLQIAQKAGDGDFYEQSAVDARLRELQRRQLEEDKKK